MDKFKKQVSDAVAKQQQAEQSAATSTNPEGAQ